MHPEASRRSSLPCAELSLIFFDSILERVNWVQVDVMQKTFSVLQFEYILRRFGFCCTSLRAVRTRTSQCDNNEGNHPVARRISTCSSVVSRKQSILSAPGGTRFAPCVTQDGQT